MSDSSAMSLLSRVTSVVMYLWSLNEFTELLPSICSCFRLVITTFSSEKSLWLVSHSIVSLTLHLVFELCRTSSLLSFRFSRYWTFVRVQATGFCRQCLHRLSNRLFRFDNNRLFVGAQWNLFSFFLFDFGICWFGNQLYRCLYFVVMWTPFP